MPVRIPPTTLSAWAIEAIEAEIAIRGEACHYEPMRRESLLSNSPSTARLAWFDRCAKASGYIITRSARTGGIVIQRAPSDDPPPPRPARA